MQHIKLFSALVFALSLVLFSCKKDAAPKNKTTLLKKDRIRRVLPAGPKSCSTMTEEG